MVNAGWFIGALRERAAKLEMQRDSVFSAYARYGQYVSLGYDCEEAKSAKEAGVAKKQTKRTKGGARTSRPAGPLAALYNLEPGTVRGDSVRSVLASQGIRVNCVNPSIIKTNIFKNEGGVLSEEQMLEKVQYYPLRRLGETTDVAWAHVFLLSDASSWVTGVDLPIDGGYILI